MDQALQDTAPVWLGGMPLASRLAELAEAGMSEVDGLLQLLEWAIRCRPLDEVELLRTAIEPHQQGMAADVVTDLRWLLGFAALRTGRYTQALALLAPLSQFDKLVDRTLGPHERGPQVLAGVLVAQIFRELGAHTSARDEATKSLDWLGDLGATDYASCLVTAGQLWKGAHLLGFELQIGLAEDALACRDLEGARTHAVAARRWLPRRAFDRGMKGRVPWRHQIMLLLLWSKLALARGWRTTAIRNTDFALDIAGRHEALPDLARGWYQRGLALLGAPFDPIQYLLDPESRNPAHRQFLFGHTLGLAAAKAESAGMPALAVSAHLTLGSLYAPQDKKLMRLHIDRAMRFGESISNHLPPELVPWWELSRMAPVRLAHIIARDERSSCYLSSAQVTQVTDERPALNRDEDSDKDEEAWPMQGCDDIPPAPELERELRAALQQVGYALADETGCGAVITPATDEDGLVVGWQPSSELDKVQTSVSTELVIKDLVQILEVMGFMTRRYEPDPSRLIVKGTYSPMLDADDEDGGDRATRWYQSEIDARHAQLCWLADTRIYDVGEMNRGIAGHSLRDLVVDILIALDNAGLPLQVDWPNDSLNSGIGIAIFPHATEGNFVQVSWEPAGRNSEYQRETFRATSRTLIERVLNAYGIVTGGNIADGSVYIFAQPTP